jgi:hypothetical protein
VWHLCGSRSFGMAPRSDVVFDSMVLRPKRWIQSRVFSDSK